MPDCVSLTPAAVREIDWLPPSCAYVRVAKGEDLSWWHPLVSGDPETVHTAGVSVRGRTVDEKSVDPNDWESHVADWPEWEPPEEI